MFDLGFAELLVIGVVALIVVGPKDLPVLFRKVGQFVGKAKGMAREFSSAMNQAADDAGVGDIQKGLNAAANPMRAATDSVKDAAKSFESWQPDTDSGSLSPERVEAAKKMHDASAKKAQERLDREAADRAAAKADDTAASEAKPKKAIAAAKPKTAPKPKAAGAAKPAAKSKTTKAAGKTKTAKTTAKTTAKSTKDSA